MAMARLRVPFLLLCCFLAGAFAATTTTVSVTSTTTVHVTATDANGACDNFIGACVVYGTYGGAPYTTTVYVYKPRTRRPWRTWAESTVTTTRVFQATTTVSNAAACNSFTGACVVYGSASASTIYMPANSQAPVGVGNGDGYIGSNQNGGGGLISGAEELRGPLLAILGLLFVLLAM